MLSARITQALVQIVSSAWVARLLTPAEIGVFAVSYATLLVANGLRGLGVNQYLLQLDTFSTPHIRSGFTLVFCFGLTLCFLFNVAAGFIGDYYAQPAMAGMLHVLSLNFLLFPVQMILQTRASRELAFAHLARTEVIATALSATLTVSLALLGFSFYALASGTVSFLIFTIVALMPRYFRRADYGLQMTHIREALDYGSWIAGSTFVTMAGQSLPDLIVGKSLGFTAAGLYDRAAAVNRMVWDQLYSAIGTVLFSTFATEKRSGQDLAHAYLHRLRGVADFLWPMLAWLVMFGDHAVVVLYGSQWVAAGEPVRALAFAAMASAPFFIAREMFFALGKTRISFGVDLLVFVARAVTLIIAARYGIFIVALSLVVPNLLFTFVSQGLLIGLIHVRFSRLLAAVIPPLLMTVLYVGLMLILRTYLDDIWAISALAQLLISGLASLTLAPILLYVTRSPLLISMKSFLKIN